MAEHGHNRTQTCTPLGHLGPDGVAESVGSDRRLVLRADQSSGCACLPECVLEQVLPTEQFPLPHEQVVRLKMRFPVGQSASTTMQSLDDAYGLRRLFHDRDQALCVCLANG